MDPAQFGALVRSLEQRARQQPRLYRLKVGLVAALGYGYIVGILLLLTGAIVLMGYLATHHGGAALLVKFMIPLLGLAYVVLRSLWIRVPEAQGVPLPPDQFPALAATVEYVRTKVDAPRFRRVLLDGDFNASIAQRPRWGIDRPLGQ